jgi:hypothetical protein
MEMAGNANLPIGGWRDAIQENDVPEDILLIELFLPLEGNPD